MSRQFRGVFIVLAFASLWAGVSTVVAQPFTIDVYPAFAPTGPTSPSWSNYLSNATGAIQLGVGQVGDREVTPDAYEWVTASVPPWEMVYTKFNSWRGSADPSATFAGLPAAFQSEYGNRIHFGVHIQGDGTRMFSMDDVDWALDSDDSTNYFDQNGSLAGGKYSAARIGIDYGANRLPDGGSGDDIVYDSGEPGSTLVDELIYVGVGDGFFSEEPAPANDQADIDATLRSLLANCSKGCLVDLAGIYTLQVAGMPTPVIGQQSVTILIEPGFGGDFNRDGLLNCKDLDLLTPQINSGANDILYDVTGDKLVNFDDLQQYVSGILNTYFGDVNCDGRFTSSDLVKVFVAGKYETSTPDDAVWTTGDWNGDGDFNSSDMVVAFVDGGYEKGPKPAISAAVVPEPTSAILALTGLLWLALGRRRRRG